MIKVTINNGLRAVQISTNLAGIPAYFQTITPSDGNCFYHSLIESMQRTDVKAYLPSHFQNLDHLSLRTKIVEYVKFNLRKFLPGIFHYIPQGQNLADYLNHQRRPAVDADHVFIQAAAYFIGLDINIVNPNSTIAKPFLKIDSETPQASNKPSILIAHLNNNHFQSLIPRNTEEDSGIFSYGPSFQSSDKFQHYSYNKSFGSSSKNSFGESSVTQSPTYAEVLKKDNKQNVSTNSKPSGKKVTKPVGNVCSKRRKLNAKLQNVNSKPCNSKVTVPVTVDNALTGDHTNFIKVPSLKPINHDHQYSKKQREMKYSNHDCQKKQFSMDDSSNKLHMENSFEENDADIDFQIVDSIPNTRINTSLLANEPPENHVSFVITRQKLITDFFEIQHITSTRGATHVPLPSTKQTLITEFFHPTVIHHHENVKLAAQKFLDGEYKHKVNTCQICYETRPDFHATSKLQNSLSTFHNPVFNSGRKLKDGICKRCHTEYLARKSKKLTNCAKFSGMYTNDNDYLCKTQNIQIRHNDQHFAPIPPYLQNLTPLEEALISKISVMMQVSILKTGMLKTHGHTISLPQPMHIARNLPRAPEEISIVVLRKKNKQGNMRHYTVQREKVQNALLGLAFGLPYGGLPVSNQVCTKLYSGPNHLSMPLRNRYFQYTPNPFYSDVVINYQRLQTLPDNPQEMPGLKVIEEEQTTCPQEQVNKAPQHACQDLSDEQKGEENTNSGLVTPLEPNTSNKQLFDLLNSLVNSQNRTMTFGIAELENVKGKPLEELKTPGFFTMAFPSVFINGTCDYTIPKLTDIPFEEWITHIFYCKDNRVTSHPMLKFLLLNLKLRKQALSTGSFLVNKQLKDAHLSIPELLENLLNDDSSVPRKIITMGQNFVNTDPYWKERAREVSSFLTFKQNEEDNLPVYFHTGSMAEYHWPALHALLAKYCATFSDLTEEEISQKIEKDSKFKHKLIMENMHIVTHYFDARCRNYFETVLRELFHIDDYWYRYEWAPSRGLIHNHSLIFSDSHYQKIKEARTPQIDDNEESIASRLFSILQTKNCDDENFVTPNFVSMHPGGGKVVTDSEGHKSWVPNKDQWATPYGTQPKPNFNPLSVKIDEYFDLPGGLLQLYIALVNRIGIHHCIAKYCFRTVSKKIVDGVEVKERICRFHFGKEGSEGKELHPFQAIVTDGKYRRYEGPRDHPRMIQHVKTCLITWQGNTDTQVIIEDDTLILRNYLTEYCCKGSKSTDAFVDIYRVLLSNSDPRASVKSIVQKLLMKVVGTIDTSEAAADYILCGGSLYHCSRVFTRIGLSFFSLLNTDGGDSATKSTPLDKFLSDERRATDPNISLWNYAKICNCPKYRKCNKLHIPLFTGVYLSPVWPPTEEYAKALLLIYAPGTWKEPEDLLGGFETFSDSLINFVDSPLCPNYVKVILQEAKKKYDQKKKKLLAKRKRTTNNIDNSQDTLSQESQQSSEGELSLGRQMLHDIQDCDHALDIDLMDELPLPDGGEDFDWHVQSFEDLSTAEVNLLDSWFENSETQAERLIDDHILECHLPKINLLFANKSQRLIIAMNIRCFLKLVRGNFELEQDQSLILIQGPGGTGKTFVINAISRLYRRIFKTNGAGMNLAPTGAASVLIPDGKTVHSIFPPPRFLVKEKDRATAEMSNNSLKDEPLAKVRKYTGEPGEDLKLQVLNMDERSMFSHILLAWASRRVQEGIGNFDYPFGGLPVVNFFGDLFQLGAICASDLIVAPLPSSPPDAIYGFSLYQLFQKVVMLDELMRQGPDQVNLTSRLMAIRSGQINENHWIEINDRYEGNLSDDEKELFSRDDTITLCETWQEVNLENHRKLVELGKPVAVIPSKGRGTHHRTTQDQMGQIPRVAHIAVGCRVMLTKNQRALTSFGLNNGAVGTIKAIVYDLDKAPPEFPKAIIVDFPKYVGPLWINREPTWVPIRVDIGRCDKQCRCERTGIPLISAYSIPIAKSQGMSIGDNHIFKRARIKLQQTSLMENGSLGTTYTALSRVDKDKNWCLVDQINFSRLECINNNKGMEKRNKEEERLRTLSKKTIAENDVSEEEYLQLLQEVDTFCNDSIFDSQCPNPSQVCICLQCRYTQATSP